VKAYLLIASLVAFSSSLVAQTGGQHIYQFLNLTNSARISALGGNTIAIADEDANMALNNPSLLNKEMDGFLGLNFKHLSIL
jgi:hypothetical protein